MNAVNRLNASTEIIPLQGPSGRNESRFRQNFRPKPKPYFVDNLIVPRVKQYLEEHKDNVHVDMDAMVDELQRKYREYGRRKRNAFKQSVDKAFKTVLAQYDLIGSEFDGVDGENTDTSDEEMFSEDISLESGNNSGQVANQLMNMYMNRPGISVTRGFMPAKSRGTYLKPNQHPSMHGQRSRTRSWVASPPVVKQEPLDLPLPGFGNPRRAESDGADKELINISSDEEDDNDAGSKEGANAKAPHVPSASGGLLPTPSTGPLLGPPPSSTAMRGVESSAQTVGQFIESMRNRERGAASRGGGGGGGPPPRVAVDASVARSWPAVPPPPAASTPRLPKRSRPTSIFEPSITITTSTKVSPTSAVDSPALKRRRETSAAAAAGGGHSPGQPLNAEFQESAVTFADLGGIDDVLEDVGRLLAHMRRPEVFQILGVPPPRGVLLHGPPGCGKSLLARAVAGELKLPLLPVVGPELVAGVSGESEARVRDLFEQAAQSAPCILFLDEVDALAPSRAGAQREMERRIVAQLLSCMDDLSRPSLDRPLGAGEVLVLGATNRPEALDPALRRAGRFDREIRLGIPDVRARQAILEVLCRTMRLAPDVNIRTLAKRTPGFVGADLQALTREAALAAVSRVLDEEGYRVSQEVEKNDKNSAASEQNVKKKDEKPTNEEKSSNKPETKEKEKEESKDDKADKPAKTIKEAEKDIEEAKQETESSKASSTRESKPGGGERMEVVELSDHDLPSKSAPSKASTEKADSSAKKVEASDDDVCIEAEVSSSDTAAKEKAPSPKDIDADMEVLDDLEDEDVVPMSGPESQSHKPVSNMWNLHFPALTDYQLKSMFIMQKDFETALKHVQPSAKREGFATVPDVSWDDVGALRDVREELQMAILAPVRHPDAFEALGLTAPAGLLLCGPPGCGKTLIAKAIANEADINFISVKGPELLNMYVGESEKAVRQCFLRARNSAPCVIFFDELDALCPRRTGAGDGSSATQRVVNQLLTEMDGVEGRRGVFLLAASNRPDILDPAVLRPGRLDRVVFVGLPGSSARADILRALTKNGTRPRLDADVDLKVLGESAALDGCSGADLASLVREAATLALREHLQLFPQEAFTKKLPPPFVSQEHLSQAMKRLRPSVTPLERVRYETLRSQFSPPDDKDLLKKELARSSVSSQSSAVGLGLLASEMEAESSEDKLLSGPVEPSVST